MIGHRRTDRQGRLRRLVIVSLAVLCISVPLFSVLDGDNEAVPSAAAMSANGPSSRGPGHQIVFAGPGKDLSYHTDLSLDRKVSSAFIQLQGSASDPKTVNKQFVFTNNSNNAIFWGFKSVFPPTGGLSNYKDILVNSSEYNKVTVSDDKYLERSMMIPNMTIKGFLFHHFSYQIPDLAQASDIRTMDSVSVYWEGHGNDSELVNFSWASLFIWNNSTSGWELVGNDSVSSPHSDLVLSINKTNPSSYIHDGTKIDFLAVCQIPVPPANDTRIYLATDQVRLGLGWTDYYYPSGLEMDLGGDGTVEWSRSGKLNGPADIYNDPTVIAGLQALIDAAGPGPGTITPAVSFASASAGRLDILNFNISYKPLKAPSFKPFPSSLTMSEDIPSNGTLDLWAYAQDDFGVPNLTFSVTFVSDPHLTVSLDADGHHLSLASSKDWFGSARFRVKAQNRYNLWTQSPDIGINITPVNDPPVLVPIPTCFVDEGQRFQLQLNATDIDGDVLRFYDDTPLFDVDPLTGKIDFVPTEDEDGNYSITVKVSDGQANVSRSFELLIKEVAEAPVFDAFPSFVTAHEDSYLDIKVRATNPDGDEITYSIRPNIFSIDPHLGTIHRLLSKADVGVYNVTVTATAGALSTDMEFSITVLAVNHPPVILGLHAAGVDGNTTLREDVGILFGAQVTDKEGLGGLKYLWSFVNGTILSHSMTFVANLSAGNYTLLFSVTDDNMVVRASLNITVQKVEVQQPPHPKPAPVPILKQPVVVGSFSLIVVVLAASIFIGGTEVGKFGFFFMLAPLYSRIRKEAALDSFTRGKIYGAILTEPGISYNMLKELTDVGNGTLAHHLKMLEVNGYIGIRRDGMYKRFYPSESTLPKSHRVLPRIQRLILSTIEERSGLSETEVAEAISVRRQVVNYHIKKLESLNLVIVQKDGNTARCYANVSEIQRSSIDLGYLETDPITNGEL